MKKIIERTLKAIVGLLMFGCVFSGIILMMCETPDWERQVSTMALGFALFCIGIIPGAVISLMASRKEKNDERDFGRIESREQRSNYCSTQRYRA